MRIVLYNIMNGGEGRADPLAEVLLAQRADVVAVVEAMTTRGEDAPLRRLARRLQMEFVTAASHADPTDVVALLSRFPILQSISVSGVRRLGQPILHATIRSLDGEVGVVVSQARQPTLQLPEAQVIVGTFETPGSFPGYLKTRDVPTRPTRQPTDVVDHLWVAPPFEIVSTRVETDRLATYASDHYPMFAELRLTR